MSKDYYKILGLERNANTNEIKEAYNKLALKWHPDRWNSKAAGDKKKANEEMEKVNEAFGVLGDEKKRKDYDMYGKYKPQSGAGFDSGIDFNDIFNSDNIFDEIFGTGRKNKNQSNANEDELRPRPGEDITIILTLDFKESILGTSKKVSLKLKKSCPDCKQTGAYSKEYINICPGCRGKGIISVTQRSLFGTMHTQVTCPDCRGRGRIISKKCGTCRSSKFIEKEEIITLKIPHGIQPDRKLSLRGMGNDGLYGAGKGDIYIETKIKEHHYFQRKNNDIHASVPISFLDAILGSIAEIITLEGIEKVKIPPGTQNNDHLILSNRGCYLAINNTRRGDFYIWWQIKLPRRIGNETTEIFKKLKENEWNPNKEFIEKNKDLL